MTNCIHPIGSATRIDGTNYDMPCKTWRCPVCGRILKNKLIDQVSLYFRGEPNVYFYTFTEQADSGREIMEDLERFRNTLYRGLKERDPQDGRKWITRWKPRPRAKAFGVKEFTQRGVRHVHMIATFAMDNEELSQRWRHATKGVSDQARITENFTMRSPAGYMMKYMAKQLDQDLEQFYTGSFQFKRHERRTFFWKPEDLHEIPKIEWDQAPEGSDEIEITLRHHWNQESKYYRSWYNDLYQHWGEPFYRFMEYSTNGQITQIRIDEITRSEDLEIDQFARIPDQSHTPGDLAAAWRSYQENKPGAKADHPKVVHKAEALGDTARYKNYIERLKKAIDPW